MITPELARRCFDCFSAGCFVFGVLLFAAAGAADPAGGSILAMGLFFGGAAAAGAAALAYVVGLVFDKWRPQRTNPNNRFLVYALLMGLPCVATSMMPLFSLIIAAGMVCGLFSYYAFKEALSASHRGFLSQRTLVWSLALGAWVLLGGRVWLEHIGFFGESLLGFQPFAPHDFSHAAGGGFAQLYGSMLLFLMPVLTIMAFADESRFLGALWALTALATAFGVAFSFSRAAWLAMIAQIVVMALLRRKKDGLWILTLAAIFGLLVLIFIPGFQERFATLFDIAHPTNVQRLEQWRFGLELLRERPFAGIGWGSFGVLYEVRSGVFYHWPHNLFLHVAVEGGAPALVVFVAWIIELRAVLRRNYHNNADGRQKSAFRDAAVATLAGLFVFGMFDW